MYIYIYVATSRYINGPWSLLHRTYTAEYWYLGVKQYNIMAFRKMSVLYVFGSTYCNEKVENYKNYKS